MSQYQDSLAKQYGEEHERFLKETNPSLHKSLSRSGQLESHLHSVGNEASELHEAQMMKASQSKEMQSLPFQQRLERLQSLQQSTQEIVRHDLIHQPVKD